MSVEFDNPTNLLEMKQIASEWIYHRPTIHHTKGTLQRVLQNELNELYEAVILKRPPNEIVMEVGDVLFSTLVLDDNPDTKNTNDYKFFESFANAHDLSLVELFKLTHYKNRVNYPITFFNKMSPFENANDAISCLRILRTANNNNSKELDDLWFQSDVLVNEQQPCFFDRGHANKIFRSFIENSLKKISRKTENKDVKKEIKRLHKVGIWEYQDLDIPNSRFNWYRLT